MGSTMTRDPSTPLPGREERRRLREAKSLSHADIAAEVGVTAAVVRSWESGRATPCGPERDAYARLLTSTEVTRRQVEEVRDAPADVPADGRSGRRESRGLGRRGDGGHARPGGGADQDEAAPVDRKSVV